MVQHGFRKLSEGTLQCQWQEPNHTSMENHRKLTEPSIKEVEKESKRNGDRILGGLPKTVSGMLLNNLLKC